MKAVFKRIAVATAVGAALTLSAGIATAAPSFTANPSSLNPTYKGPFNASSITVASSERLDFSNPFDVTGSGWVEFSQFDTLGANVTGLTSQYNLYLLFNLEAVNPQPGGNGTTVYTLNALNFTLYADVSGDNTFNPSTVTGNSASAATVTNPANDDIVLGSGTLINGTATLLPANGVSILSTEQFSLTSPAGTSFFTNPVPFYTLAFDSFVNNSQGITYTDDRQAASVTSGGTITFNKVPEPSSLALFGIAAVGLGLSARRRKA